MGTNFIGRLRNTSLSSSRPLVPLFEVVVNSIHAIEDAYPSPDEGRISIEVIREDNDQLTMSSDIESAKGTPISFRVTDNGIGFTDENMDSFTVLDSQYKQARGGRGMGRLFWLKAFQDVAVKSVFKDDEGTLHIRSFDFNEERGVHNERIADANKDKDCQTTVFLNGLHKRFQKAMPKS